MINPTVRAVSRSVSPASQPDLRILCRLGVVIVLGTFATVAAAKDQGPNPAVREACTADFKTLCSDVQPGGGRVVACLKQNADKLSPGCRSAMASAKGAQ